MFFGEAKNEVHYFFDWVVLYCRLKRRNCVDLLLIVLALVHELFEAILSLQLDSHLCVGSSLLLQGLLLLSILALCLNNSKQHESG